MDFHSNAEQSLFNGTAYRLDSLNFRVAKNFGLYHVVFCKKQYFQNLGENSTIRANEGVPNELDLSLH